MKLSPCIALLLLALALSNCATAHYGDADSMMERGEYFQAARAFRIFESAARKKNDKAKAATLALKQGICCQKLGQYARAEACFRRAIKSHVPDSSAQLFLAQALHSQGKYAEAIKEYEAFLQGSPRHLSALSGIKGAKAALSDSMRTRHKVRPFRPSIGGRSEYAAAFRPGEDGALYFTSTAEGCLGKAKDPITGMKSGDIYRMQQNEHKAWLKPVPLDDELNTEADEGAISFSPNGSTMYFSRASKSAVADQGVEIWTSERKNAKWGEPVRIEIGDNQHSYAHPSVSPDGRWLYFASDMPGGFGGKDIWRISLCTDQATPQNMGPAINTRADEMFPFARADSLLYFSSDGHPGFGGLDLFKASFSPLSGWTISNMGIPMNSAADDFAIAFCPEAEESGFFSSNRGDSRGYDHLFSFELPPLKIAISGHVFDSEKEPLRKASVKIVGNDGSIMKTETLTDGSFSFSLSPAVSYAMLASASGYLNSREEFATASAEEDAQYGIDFMLAPIEKPVVLENVFFDYDKATLRSESQAALNELATLLKANPHVCIEMAAHTDRHGAEEYNALLSQRRAQAVVDFLIKAGIEADRLMAKGYGKSSPKVVTRRIAEDFPQFKEGEILNEDFIKGLSEEEQAVADQLCRRTEFKVTSIVYNLY